MATREQIIKLFMSEPQGKNADIYMLSYEFRKQQYRDDKPILTELLKENLVKVISKSRTTILYRYYPPTKTA